MTPNQSGVLFTNLVLKSSPLVIPFGGWRRRMSCTNSELTPNPQPPQKANAIPVNPAERKQGATLPTARADAVAYCVQAKVKAMSSSDPAATSALPPVPLTRGGGDTPPSKTEPLAVPQIEQNGGSSRKNSFDSGGPGTKKPPTINQQQKNQQPPTLSLLEKQIPTRTTQYL